MSHTVLFFRKRPDKPFKQVSQISEGLFLSSGDDVTLSVFTTLNIKSCLMLSLFLFLIISNTMLPPRNNKNAVVVAVLALLFSKRVFGLSTPAQYATTNKLEDSKEVQQEMIKVHASEVAGGMEAFSDSTSGKTYEISSWNDNDFLGYHMGENHAGVDATVLPKNGNMVFESKSPVLSDDECSFIVEEARETILRGLAQERRTDTNDSPHTISNSQLIEARLSNMPKTRDWLKETLPTRFYPLLKDRFGLDDLVLYDGLVLANHAPTRSQPIHRDASLLTLNVALSSSTEYEGGGTYVEALDEILIIDKGHLLCHAGSTMHAGNAITQGERWVFVLFLLGPNQPQLARRSHARAIEHMRAGEFDTAETCLHAGLESIAPHQDHLLQGTLGRLYLAQGKPKQALQSFQTADEAYPLCQNALVSMAQLLMEKRRPRAALRRLDQALERINDRDLQDRAQLSLKSLAYATRRDAARCALLCAEYLYSKKEETWSLGHLPTAISRLHTCLAAAPNEPTLLGMLDRVDFLLEEAKNHMRK